MGKAMSPKERVLTALNREEPDRVPIAMRKMEPLDHLWGDLFERAVVLRDRFGIDDFIQVGHGWPFDPSVRETQEWKTWGEQNYPLLVTEYHTPAGILHNEVVMTEDFHVERLNLGADALMPRMVVRTIKDRDDVARFRYLLPDPSRLDLTAWGDRIRQYVDFGREEGIPIGFVIPSPSGIALKNVGTLDLVTRAVAGTRGGNRRTRSWPLC